jgi:Flp pilus assembly protein TadG
MGITAIAVDGGLLLDDHERVQSAADTAALAAAADLYANYLTGNGLDPNGTASKGAFANAAANGFTNDGVASIVTVNIPPTSGPFTGKPSYAEVIIQYNQKRGFSNIFGDGDIPVKARAVAQGSWSTIKDGILVLDPTLKGSLSTGGGGSINITGGAPVIVDSNNAQAAIANGGGSMSAPLFDITGVPGTGAPGGGSFTGTIYSGVPPTPDPLRYLPAPDPTTMALESKNATQIAGTKNVTLYPGVYVGGIKVTGQGNVTLMPGIYYMQGGGFSYTGQGNLNATGVMIYNAPQSSSDTVNVSGSGSVNWTPPTSGLYQGLSIFQDRTATATVTISGGGSMYITGTFYAAAAQMNISGSGTTNYIGSQYISYDLALGGNGNISIDYGNAPIPRSRVLKLVE